MKSGIERHITRALEDGSGASLSNLSSSCGESLLYKKFITPSLLGNTLAFVTQVMTAVTTRLFRAEMALSKRPIAKPFFCVSYPQNLSSRMATKTSDLWNLQAARCI